MQTQHEIVMNMKAGETVMVNMNDRGPYKLTADINKRDNTLCVVIHDDSNHIVGYMWPQTFLNIYQESIK